MYFKNTGPFHCDFTTDFSKTCLQTASFQEQFSSFCKIIPPFGTAFVAPFDDIQNVLYEMDK